MYSHTWEVDNLGSAIARARACSPFLTVLLDQESDIVQAFEKGVRPDLDLDDTLPVARRLRRARRRGALAVALGDLRGDLDLTAVTAALTDFADRALDVAIRAAIIERSPGADPCGFAAIALGKQGSRELNYSSDIDLIFLFDPETLPRRAREEPEDAAVRVGRRVVELLQERDADGYVLRVDLRLRPSPEATPIALSIGRAIAYYESQALAWERAAFIRARAAAGDRALGQSFLDAIRPFIWRRGLDYGAITDIRDITRRIRDHYAQGQAFGPGYDLKRGRGGIREIEFFAQSLQLIHGGRDFTLRAAATCDALAALAGRGLIADEDAGSLSTAYTTLRTIEHRLQMVDDRQTHTLPIGAALDNVARLHGLPDAAALLALLGPHVTTVAARYDALEPSQGPALSIDVERLTGALAKQGFADAADAARLVAHWRDGAYPALRTPAARAALEQTLPYVMTALGAGPDPRAALNRLDRMMARLPSAINFFRLLQAQPGLAAIMAAVLGLAPTLAEALARRPVLLDGLVDASALQPVADVATLVVEMRGTDHVKSYEGQLDHVRQVVGEQRFAAGVQLIVGPADPLDVGRGYARIAEAAVAVLAEATVADFAGRHGRVPDSELVILALGRLGGSTLTQASDLDLVYLFTGDFRAESDGPKPLGASLYYNRLAQRLTAALSAPTAAGDLYRVDARLRPSGTQGPLAVSLDSFVRYQREDAWTWEHMALTRARPVWGSTAARATVGALLTDVLEGSRHHATLVEDARTMRAEIMRHKPPAGLLDVKRLPGGLIDLEFAVHVRQLASGQGLDPDLDRAIELLTARGLLRPGIAPAYRLLTRLLITLRLVAPDAAPPSAPTRTLIARAVGCADWAAVVASLDDARQEVSRAWAATGGE